MYEVLEKLLKERGLRVADVCRATGLSQSMMSDWKKGKYKPKTDKLQKLADFFEVPLETFTGDNGRSIHPVFTKEKDRLHLPKAQDLLIDREKLTRQAMAIPHRNLIPVLGNVAAGSPIDADQEILGWEEVGDDFASGDFYALKIHGNSMSPSFEDGKSTVIVEKQSYAEDGDYVIAVINGNDATCKLLKKYESGIALISLNPAYKPMYFSATDLETIPVRIIGKVKEVRTRFF